MIFCAYHLTMLSQNELGSGSFNPMVVRQYSHLKKVAILPNYHGM